MPNKITKKDWIEFFPFKEVRPIQEESINFILNSFLTNGKKYCLVEAPTGVGKSAIAVTVSKYFQYYQRSALVRTAWITTTQRILQRQYQRDFSWMPTIWSKNHYECPDKMGISCQFGTLVNDIFKGKYCDCIYKKDKKLFLEDEISMTNLSFLLNHIEYTQEIDKRKLLIVDECHTLDNALTEFVSITLDKFTIKEYGVEWIGINKSIEEVVHWIENDFVITLGKLKERVNIKIKTFDQHTILSDSIGKKLIKQLNDLDRYISQLNRCISRFNVNEWVMSINKEEDEITLKPIFSSRYSQKQLFCKGEKILLMSGTILDKEVFCRNIGIPKEETEFISLDSPFKKENRMIFAASTASLSHKNIDKSLPKISMAIEHIINEHKSDKGLIHANSYKVANYITKHVKHKNRFITHDSSNRIEMYELHLKSKQPTILVSPSLTEGIDLYDDLSRFQIIVKVPFPYLGDNFIVEKMKRVQNWYSWETAKTIIQSSGRSIRNVDDNATTYILDKDFIFFYKQNSNLFPSWWRQSLVFI